MATWKFEKKLRSQKGRDPFQDSFFTNESIEDDTHAIVRESIQNALDAKLNNGVVEPVIVRYRLGSLPDASTLDRYISAEAWNHFHAAGNGLVNPPKSTDICNYLVYEDFNTTGLVGDEHESEPTSGNSFCYFMRAEGQSGKDEGDRGRHGIGKFVFPKTSQIRTFLMATVRADDQRCLVAGQSLLKSHYVSGVRFSPDGWWGKYEGDEHDKFQLPVEDKKLFQKIKDDFGLARNTDETGLSIVIPFVQTDIHLTAIADYAIREYFYPILTGELVIQLSEHETELEINSDTLKNDVQNFMSPEAFKKFEPILTLALKALNTDEILRIDLPLPDGVAQPLWTGELVTKNIAEEITSGLQNGTAVRVKVPLYVYPEASLSASESFFYIYLIRDLDERSKKVLFIREGITIPEEKAPILKGYTSIISIQKGHLATLLGDSENPAHTEWEKNATRFRSKYKWGAKTIDFVRHSVAKLLNLLNQADDELDKNVLADIFWIDHEENEDQVPEKRKQKKAKKQKNGAGGKPEIDIERRPRYYRINKLNDGFKIIGDENLLTTERRFTIKVAYDLAGASKPKVLKLYHKNDFDLGNDPIKIKTRNVRELQANRQEISFIASSEDFEINVEGFDHNRDILVDVNSREIINEEI